MKLQNDNYRPALPESYFSVRPAFGQPHARGPYLRGNDNYGPALGDHYAPGNSGGRPFTYNSRDDSSDGLETYLHEPLSPDLSAASLHDQIFGHQLQSEKYTLSHLDQTVEERKKLHRQHIKDLNHRLCQLQEDLGAFRLQRYSPMSREELKLKSEIHQLEKQKRKEELDYWKDVAEINKENLETALQYEASKRRAGLFQGMEL